MNVDLKDIPTPQLQAIRQILVAGVPSKAETEPSEFAQREQLCHKSPPKGSPKDKSQYGDPACYRYPLNTKARCLAAWRYVHQADNKSILGSKFKSVESKIKSYAKSHYELDLQVGESQGIDWEQVFLEYYDAETMGERSELIELEEASSEGKNIMEEKELIDSLNKQVSDLTADKDSLTTERDTLKSEKAALEEKASQLDELTKELNEKNEELETLRRFKQETEEAAEKAERIKNIKAQLDEAGIEANLDEEAEASYWLNMSEEVLKLTISKMGALAKRTTASASMKVPQIPSEDDSNNIDIVRSGLQEMKNDRK
jgi:hypothetical protein